MSNSTDTESNIREKKYLSEESEGYQDLKEQWRTKAKSIKTIDEFVEFYNDLFNNYRHDYGVCIDAASCLAMAAASLAAHKNYMTGFQMSCVMWDYMHWMHFPNSKTGIKLLHYDDMLYPQYSYKFQKTIDRNIWCKLQKAAKENLMDNTMACHDVKAHWQSIIDGNIPFGYKLTGDK